MEKKKTIVRPAISSTPIADLMDEFDKLLKRDKELNNRFDSIAKVERQSIRQQMCDLSDKLEKINKRT